jgi:two-component system chemotaxis sensor kinase CheA
MSELDEGFDPSLRTGFIDESLEGLAQVSGLLGQLEQAPGRLELVQAIFRPVHSIKGNSAYFGMLKVKALAHELETLLDLLRKGALTATPGMIGMLLRGVDALAGMFDRTRRDEPEVVDLPAFERLVQAVVGAAQGERISKESQWRELLAALERGDLEEARHLAQALARESLVVPAAAAQPAATGGAAPAGERAPARETVGEAAAGAGKPAAARTMRVAEESIDAFLGHVGGLVTIGEMYEHLYLRMQGQAVQAGLAAELRRVNESFGELSLQLQGSIMNVRKIALHTLLQRFPRMVRELAARADKQVSLVLEGGEILVDKSLLENLDAPLMHMVRNAVDHGVESVEKRQAAGKPAAGRLRIAATESAAHIRLVVADDGRGLDRDALRDKAVALGICRPGATLTEAEIVDLLFLPGVSTAREVTDISGRGVGMDVVRRNVDAMGGVITVQSTAGVGTEFAIQIPKTVSTQILTGFIMVLGGNRYVVPLSRVARCVQWMPENIHTLQGRGECLADGADLLRILRLARVLQVADGASGGIFVILAAKGPYTALLVDQIEGVRQVVSKQVDGITNECFQGAAVMGDGTVAMILDVDRLTGRK